MGSIHIEYTNKIQLAPLANQRIVGYLAGTKQSCQIKQDQCGGGERFNLKCGKERAGSVWRENASISASSPKKTLQK